MVVGVGFEFDDWHINYNVYQCVTGWALSDVVHFVVQNVVHSVLFQRDALCFHEQGCFLTAPFYFPIQELKYR